jgi:precorrin-3B synthase
MTAPLVRGWCPSLYEPMAAADGLIARIKPFVHGLFADDLRLIADLADLHGSGAIELTSRANLQVRGLTQVNAPRFAKAVAAAGLASPDPAAERRRNIQVTGDCGPKLLSLARDLEVWLQRASALDALPSKFGFAFTAGQPVEADIVIAGEDAPLIRIAGAPLAATASDPLTALQTLTLGFVNLAGRLSPPPRRMKALVERMSARTLLAQAGLSETPARTSARYGREVLEDFDLGVVFGVLDSARLHAVADLADRYGDGRVRPLPDRRLRLCKVATEGRATLSQAALQAGFAVHTGDPRLRLRACIGRHGCARTLADVRADALALAPLLPANAILHVSGCVKGCAHPRAADVTLAATGAYRYDVVLQGAAGDAPTSRDLTLDQIAHDLQAQDR